MTHYLLAPDGGIDRRAIHARAKALWSAAKARGDDRPFGAHLSYAYRVARGQHEAATWSRVEAQARETARRNLWGA